ncbi:MAG: hypothetical protein U0174_16070 [Polyangiaceae bacterium]
MQRLTTLGVLFGLSLVTTFVGTGCAADATEGEEPTVEDNLTASDKKRVAAIRAIAAKDVEVSRVTFTADVLAPKASAGPGYSSPRGPSLYGVDWFQKWEGGVSANHDWEKGTEIGKRCMWAATLRFEAIMKNPPAELKAFMDSYTRWGGRFYNWVDDYSKDGSYGTSGEANLWAWATGLSKWISSANKDGSCNLPTRKMVVDYAAACKAHVARPSNNNEMKGCSL